jgi:signal peptidase II
VTLLVALTVLFVSLKASDGVSAVGFGLLLGGGVANTLDRLAATPHEVTDFISVGSFPVFNLADASVTIGFVVLIVAALRGERLLRR